VIDTDGKERLLVETQVLGSSKGFGVIGAIGSRDTEMDDGEMSYADGRPGGFDPHKRIPDMDLDGIDAAFLYRASGLFAGAVKDPRAGGRDVPRLQPLAGRLLPALPRPALRGRDAARCSPIPLAIEEMRFARKELGMRGGFLRPNPYNDKMLHHPDYEPFWSAAEDLDFSIGLHEGASGGMPQAGVDRFAKRGAKHIVSHTVEMMLAAMSVIWEGVCDRHPRCDRVPWNPAAAGSRAGSTGWIRHFDDKGFNDSGLSMRPSDLFQRNCWISFEPVSAASACWPTTSARTRSCGRPTIRTRRVLPRRAEDDRRPAGAVGERRRPRSWAAAPADSTSSTDTRGHEPEEAAGKTVGVVHRAADPRGDGGRAPSTTSRARVSRSRDLGIERDPLWWAKKLVEREKVSLMPPALALRRTWRRRWSGCRGCVTRRRCAGLLEALNAQIAS
jgi:hypothetical protein